MENLTNAARDVLAERQRQKTAEGWTVEHDDQHIGGQLARAAAAYAYYGSLKDMDRASGARADSYIRFILSKLFPAWGTVYGGWDWLWWKPTSRRRDLVKAGALILAEIERLDRSSDEERV